MKRDLTLGVHADHHAASMAVVDAERRVVYAKASVHGGDLRSAVAWMLSDVAVDRGRIDRVAAAGIGASAVTEFIGGADIGEAAAAAEALALHGTRARTVVVLGGETALLARVDPRATCGHSPSDIRIAGPCGSGVGAFLRRWAPEGCDPADVAGIDEAVSCRCVCVATLDLARCRADGRPAREIAALAIRSAARILAGAVVQGGPVDAPVALMGREASVSGFAAAVAAAMGFDPASVFVCENAATAVAVGAAVLARSVGGPPSFGPLVDAGAGARHDPPRVAGGPTYLPCSAARARRAVGRAHEARATWVLDVSGTDALLAVCRDGLAEPRDVSTTDACRRGLAGALEGAAQVLGLAGVAELSALARSSARGVWLRDRCAQTVAMDASSRLLAGDARADVARGVFDAVARGLRRSLAQRLTPVGALALVGDHARVEAFADAVGRAFRCTVVAPPIADAADAPVAARVAEAGDDGGTDFTRVYERILQEHITRRARGARLGVMALPMGLGMAERAPFWSRFLAEIGFDVALLDRAPTESETAAAATRTAGLPCGAAIALRGEVEALGALHVDGIFLPVEVDAPARAERTDGAPSGVVYRCPFLQAGAHLVGAAGVVRPIRFLAFSPEMNERSLVRSMAPWRIAPGAIRRAIGCARAAEREFERDLGAATREVARQIAGARAVVLLGRAYSIRRLPEEVSRRLRAHGVALVPQQLLTVPDDLVARAAEEMYWDSGQKILAAAMRVASEPTLGAFYLTHTRCGPDSFVKKYARTILRERPWALLDLDAGRDVLPAVGTADAFRYCFDAWCAEARAGTAAPADGEERAAVASPKPTVVFPDMGVASDAGVAALTGFEISARAVRADEESLRAAACHTSGDECLPYIVTIGNLVKTVEGSGFDPAQAAFFMATSSGSCRFGQYRRGFRQVLDAMGLHDTRIITLNQSEGHTRQMPGFAFARLLWQGMMALGAVDRVGLHLRPRSADPERADAVWDECRRDVTESLERRVSPHSALGRCARRFDALELDPGAVPVRIAVTGEIFVRSQPFTSGDLVRAIERAGGEAVVPPFQEWIYHVNRCVRIFARARGRTMAVWGLRAAGAFLRHGERSAERALGVSDPPPEQPTIEDVWAEAHGARFIPWFGDASLALGRAIAMRRRGARGAVNIVPYGCLPGTTAEAVFASRRAALGGMPVLHLHLDGGPEVEVRSQVRALVEAALAYEPRRTAARGAPV
jgi:predicted nucleotide-binding protein (sugar kinase/HSP70/actin superfamily)/activator of 2-hydroxyglutaryl-CoA dehydratase